MSVDREQVRRGEPSRYADPYTRIAWLRGRVEELETALEQVERERDALVVALRDLVFWINESHGTGGDTLRTLQLRLARAFDALAAFEQAQERR